MRIAICFSGQVRTGVKCFENIKSFLGDLYPDCDFFFHAWDSNSHAPTICFEDYTLIPIDEEEIESLISLYKPKKYMVENYMNSHKKCYFQHEHHPPFNGRFYSWEESIKLKKEYEIENNFVYDFVLKFRFDIIFSPKIKLSNIIGNVKENEFGVEHVYTSDLGNKILDDSIFVSKSDVMDIASKWDSYHREFYVEIHNQYKDYINDHAILYKYLNNNGITVNNLNLQNTKLISMYRPEAFRFDPLNEYYKCYEVNHLTYWNGKFNTYLTNKELSQLIQDLKNDKRFRIDNIKNIRVRNLI